MNVITMPRRDPEQPRDRGAGKPHADVMRYIMPHDGGAAVELRTAFCLYFKHLRRRERAELSQYDLEKDTSLVLLLGYDIAARIGVLKSELGLSFSRSGA